MPEVTTPGPVSTGSGVQLPIVALPQKELLTVNEGDVPIMKDAFGEGIHFQPLRLDLEHNEWVVLARFAPGTSLPLHYHTGPVDLYTLQGRWLYAEYPDQPQTAGSYLYEPGGSVHTLYAPADNTEETVFLVRVTGSNVNFNEDGSFHSLLDTLVLRHLTDNMSADMGEKPRYVQGGDASFTLDA